MTTIFELVKTALDTLSPAVPYGMGTYLCDGKLPDQYITYSLIDGVSAQHADDAETQRGYRVQISIFDRAGLAALPDVDAAMLAADFTKGPERQLDREEESGHYGLAKDYFYLE
jgi:aminoglycoside phosphotransferase (APT) family kinase protein